MTIRLAMSCAAVLAATAFPAAADSPVCAKVTADTTVQTCTPYPTTGVCEGEKATVGTTEVGAHACVANPADVS